MARPTEAQRRALEVLQSDGVAFVSNFTSSTDVGRRCVYWQTARWLVNRGFAERAGWEDGQEKLVITRAGKEA